ncbi:MAG: type II toxin-antitoxin system prevent-host-death family antitoxin [Patulibacter sp.]
MTPTPEIKPEVGIAELHEQLSRYVEHAEAGGEVFITAHGKRVARLAPVEAPAEPDPLAALRARGLVRAAKPGTWEPNPQRPVVGQPISDFVAEQRR